MKTSDQIRQSSGMPWNQRKKSIIDQALALDPPLESTPSAKRMAQSVANLGCLRAGQGQYDAAVSLDEIRLVWWELHGSSIFDDPGGARTGISFDDFFALPILKRVAGFCHPPTGILLNSFLLTDKELAERFTFKF